MKERTVGTDTITIGIDVSDRYSHFCFLDGEGEILEEGRVRTTEIGLRSRFRRMDAARIALEAGTHSPWISRLLLKLGHEVIVANPRKVRLIYENESKSDKVDAEYLARVARLDRALLAPVSHRGAETQSDLAILRARDTLVTARTKLINHVRGAVKSMGARLPTCGTKVFSRKVASAIPEDLRPALSVVLQMIDDLTKKIQDHNRLVRKLAEKYPQTAHLQRVHGVGPLTAVGFVLTLEDPERFKNSRAVGSYLGLRPRQSDSGDREPQLRITKTGDSFLRRLLVGSAQYILGPFGRDSDLRRWGLGLAARGGKNAKKRAVVAVARKLATLLHRLWVTGEAYEPLRNSERRDPEQVPA